ncbi:YggS family pyridoxal phosphate-dependent enzyme [soil metagenome]
MSLSQIQSRLSACLAEAGRPLDAAVLIAVSKLQPQARVRAVLEAGHRVFGENRVQEAEVRWPPLRDAFGPVALHLVGPLQSNKVRRAVERFEAIHSLDRDRLARRLADAVQEAGRCPALFIQINTGREAQKAGCAPDALDPLLKACRGAYGLDVTGLMCLPPADEDPGPHFALLRDLAARHGLEGLSMGMSADFETAIAHGATHVRIGSAIFGAREG